MEYYVVQKQGNYSYLQHPAEMAVLEDKWGHCFRQDIVLSAAAAVFLKLAQSGNVKVLCDST